MINIVHVAGSAAWAGGERQLTDLLTHLDRAQFGCSVICPEEGPLIRRLTDKGVPAQVVELAPLINPAAAHRLTAALRRLSPAIVQSHGARSNFYARWACRRLGLKHVSTIHNALRDYPVSRPRKAAYQWLDRFTSRWSDRVVCVSESLRKDMILQGVAEDKLTVIHNGVDLGAFDPSAASSGDARGEEAHSAALRRQWGCRDLLLGVIGRMTEQKGHRYLIEALPSIAEKFPGVKAVFVGDGPLREQLGSQAERARLADRVVFAGVRSDMASVFSALDIVVLPSLSEGMPYVMLEAMAMERPVVASAVDGVTEAAADGREARLAPPGDARALAEAVVATAEDPDKAKQMARRGRERIMREFSLETMVGRWTALYSELAAGRPAAKS